MRMGTAAMTGPRAKGIRGPQASAAAGGAAGRAPEPAAGTGHRHLVFRLGICSLTEPGPSGWGRGGGPQLRRLHLKPFPPAQIRSHHLDR